MSAESPREEELSLSGRATPAEAGPEVAPRIAARVGQLQVSASMTNEELLEAVLGADPDKLIPWELVNLPSGGRFYLDADGNPWPDGIVQVRAMGQTAEKVLATQRLAETGQSLDYLFRECCQFPGGFDPVDLLVGDRMFLLYYIRGITHGNVYEFVANCPNSECGKASTHTYDLNELASTIKGAEGLGAEPFKIVLPYMSEVTGREFWVRVRFLRGTDSNTMVARRKAKQRAFGKARPGQQGRQSLAQRKAAEAREQVSLDNAVTEHLEQVITDVMGVNNPFTIRAFEGKLHAQDTATIREWLRDRTPGIDSTVRLECQHCGHEFTVELPITESFFRPQRAG